jgi:uncharacterized protein YecT (DUF1311 family)
VRGSRLLLMLLVAVSSSGALAATGPPTLPSEAAPNSLASFRCPNNPGTTLDIEVCQAQQLLRYGRSFNRQAAILWSLLDTRGRRAFTRAHNGWLVYRDQECDARARSAVGGTARGVIYGQCLNALTAARIREVKATILYYCEGRVRTGPRRNCPRT